MPVDDSRPIWIQLVETFSQKIASGQWAPSSRIPSVRELAIDAGVNPNTVQRALTRLDAEGLTVAERAQGRFVTTDTEAIATARAKLAAQATDSHISAVRQLGLEREEAISLLTARWIAISAEGGDEQ
ncbi:GntR family transcriptional regulator [Schaalia cardiffensis]